jgi:hypothetical protein
VLETATAALVNDQPLLIAYGTPQARWCLVTGHRPAEGEVYLLRPGSRQAIKLTADEFVRVWQASKVPALWPQGSISGLQFALTVRQAEPDTVAVIKSTVLQASLAWGQTELMRQPAGAAAHRAWVESLAQAVAGTDARHREQVKSWATQAIPLVVTSRRAAGRFFTRLPEGFSATERAALAQAGSRYEEIAAAWEALRETLAQAPQEAVSPGGEGDEATGGTDEWPRALYAAEHIEQLESDTLGQLAAALAE